MSLADEYEHKARLYEWWAREARRKAEFHRQLDELEARAKQREANDAGAYAEAAE